MKQFTTTTEFELKRGEKYLYAITGTWTTQSTKVQQYVNHDDGDTSTGGVWVDTASTTASADLAPVEIAVYSSRVRVEVTAAAGNLRADFIRVRRRGD